METTHAPTKAFSDLLKAQHTDRDLMKALGIGHPALKQRLADPSLFTMRELRLVATLLGRPEMEVARVVFDGMSRNPETTAALEQSAEQVVGRQRARRSSKEGKTEG